MGHVVERIYQMVDSGTCIWCGDYRPRGSLHFFFVDMMVSVSAAIVILRTGRLSAVCVGWSRKLRISGAISPVEMIKFT